MPYCPWNTDLYLNLLHQDYGPLWRDLERIIVRTSSILFHPEASIGMQAPLVPSLMGYKSHAIVS